MRAFLVALQFLTIVPVPRAEAPSERLRARSVLYYPVVGVALGGVLIAAAWFLARADALLAAALIVALWAVLTGGLHLDGLADTLDAWIGGRGDRAKTLAIMKDPHRGAIAIVGVVLLLMLKVAALAVLLRHGAWWLLMAAPVLGRTALVALFATTPYVREHGLGAAAAAHLSRAVAVTVVAATLIALALVIGLPVLGALGAAVVATLVLRAAVQRRLGGSTGDTLGASCEIIEACVLVALAFGTTSR